LDIIARSFHFKNLKRAVEQFGRGEKVIPLISYLKDGKLFEVTKVKGTVEAALHIIEEKFEPDALNLVIMPTNPIPFSEDSAPPMVPRQLLFAMTFDHLGSRWVSLFEVKREGSSIELKDVRSKDLRSKAVSIETTPDGDLEIHIDPMRPRNRAQG
jgi:hypothetical protein